MTDTVDQDAIGASTAPASPTGRRSAGPSRQRGWRGAVKRALDVVGATAVLVILVPVLVMVAVAIKLDSRGPVFFHQTRVGRDKRPFTVHKFRSMVAGADPELHRIHLKRMTRGGSGERDGSKAEPPNYKIQNDPRITRVGRFVRRTSLDELPQLWNVVKGEMSLVGPRPEVPYSIEDYEPEHHRRFDVLPGLTGLWQVSGRSRLSQRQMLELDVEYVERWSLGFDVWLLLRTVPAVLRPERAG